MTKRECRYFVVVGAKGLNQTAKVLDLANSYGLRLGKAACASFAAQAPVSFSMPLDAGSTAMEIIGICEREPEAFVKECNSMDCVQASPLSGDKLTAFMNEINKGVDVPGTP